jgi:hypothetical protein
MPAVTVTASTGALVRVSRHGEIFHAGRAGRQSATQICLAVDLFEIIAELAGLELEDADQADEAMQLSEQALRRLDGRRVARSD